MYRVVDWSIHFENNRTKELKKLAWVPMPNKQDGDGYTELLDHPDGAAHFGCWCAIVEVASKCDPRGTLSRQGAVPHTAASLSRITRIPEAIMEDAIQRLVSQVKWLEIVPDSQERQDVTEIPQASATTPQDDASTRVRAGVRASNGRELNGKESSSPNPSAELRRQQDATTKRIASLGVNAARQAVCAAVAAGVTLDEIEAIANHYERQNGNRPEALQWRIANAVPGVAPELNWPPKWSSITPREQRKAVETAKETTAFLIVRDGRRAKKPDEVIAAELQAAGVDWPK